MLIWTIIPAIVCPNPPLDVIEGYVWGNEWLIGTYKHPPMQAWWLEILHFLTGQAEWSHFFASQLAIITTFWTVWRLALRILDPRSAFVAVLLLEGVVYYNFTSPEFNPNVLQLPFWALICLYFHRAIREGRLMDWGLLGMASAGGLYSKYSTVLLLAALVIFALARPESRRKLSTPGPYVALVVAGLIFLPHVLWLVDNHFLPFNYARERLQPTTDGPTIHSVILIPLLFIGSQVLAILPALLMSISLMDRRRPDEETVMKKFDRDFLTTITFGPFFLIIIVTSVLGLQVHDMWAMPFWSFIGVWLLSIMRPVLSARSLQRFALSGLIVFSLVLIAYVGGTYYYPYLTNKGLRIHFPGNELADQVNQSWAQHHFDGPLRYVIGDTWPAGNIAYYTPGRPHVLIAGNYDFSQWVDPDDLRHKGGIIVWCVSQCSFGNHKESPPEFLGNFPDAAIQPPLTLDRQTGANIKPVVIGWAILAPRT